MVNTIRLEKREENLYSRRDFIYHYSVVINQYTKDFKEYSNATIFLKLQRNMRDGWILTGDPIESEFLAKFYTKKEALHFMRYELRLDGNA